ncbi:fatty acid CoA ligase family protein [Desulfatitalea tepidiphila]|uniref:fatty acid CoA ligase family protein n=1 Tax=Desulfatitalea tepidiphila TaxID=1185843 RepID=UPI0006B661C3|nr:fatty acid CoA ligase family protein [Desulfatitalea tepidiphila]
MDDIKENPDRQRSEADPQTVNVALHLRTMARIQPYRRAVVYPASRDYNGRVAYSHLTFRQLDRESDCFAHGLEAAGIRRGTRTILMVRPSLELFAIIYAMLKVGAVFVMVDPGMGVQRMLACLKESRAEALIGIPPAHVLRTLQPKYFKGIRKVVTIGRRWFWGGLTLKDIRRLPWQPYTIADTRRDETAAILFTTGSTGAAKGAIYTHGIFDAQVRLIKSQFGISPDEIDLPTFPLFSLFDAALGMTAVIPDMDPTRPAHVNPDKIIEAVLNHGVTNMFASPALLNRVGRYGQENNIKLPSLKRIITSGAPVSPDNLARFTTLLEEDAEIHTGYGATEAMPVSSFGSKQILGETAQLTEQGFGMCVGPPIQSLAVQIITITDTPIESWSDNLLMPDGEIGEIAVYGDIVTQGYFDRPLDDKHSKIEDGQRFWHRMGDLAWKDKKGRIWYCGRKTHRVITPYGTLFTIPCEAIFNNHPAVFRSALVGVGQAPRHRAVICIELEPEHRHADRQTMIKELQEMAAANPQTEKIDTFLFHPGFPVDIRHNSKIFREKLADWARNKLG